MRYDKDTKSQAVRRAIHYGIRNAAWYMDIPEATIKKWIKQNIPYKTAEELEIEKSELQEINTELKNRIKELELTIEKTTQVLKEAPAS